MQYATQVLAVNLVLALALQLNSAVNDNAHLTKHSKVRMLTRNPLRHSNVVWGSRNKKCVRRQLRASRTHLVDVTLWPLVSGLLRVDDAALRTQEVIWP